MVRRITLCTFILSSFIAPYLIAQEAASAPGQLPSGSSLRSLQNQQADLQYRGKPSLDRGE